MKSNHAYDYSPAIPNCSCDFTTSMTAGNTNFHIHDHHEIYMLLDGTLNYFVENVCYPMVPGHVILFSKQEIHKAINTAEYPFSRLVIHINPAYVNQFCTKNTNLLSCFHRKPGVGNLVLLPETDQKHLLSMAQTLNQALTNKNEYGNDLTVLTTVIQILLLINKAWQSSGSASTATKPHRAQAIMDHIDRNLTSELTLASIADALSLDKYYLSHLFKSATESSIFQYILIKRIALAKELLLSGHTVSEACHLSGFNDYSNFIRTFRQNTGCTPGQFKKSNQ